MAQVMTLSKSRCYFTCHFWYYTSYSKVRGKIYLPTQAPVLLKLGFKPRYARWGLLTSTSSIWFLHLPLNPSSYTNLGWRFETIGATPVPTWELSGVYLANFCPRFSRFPCRDSGVMQQRTILWEDSIHHTCHPSKSWGSFFLRPSRTSFFNGKLSRPSNGII